MIALFLNGESLDVYDNTTFQITKTGLDLSDLTKRKVTFTNTFKVPKTKRNLRIILGVQYELATLSVIEDGVEQFVGSAVIKEKSNVINIAGVEKAINIFDILKKVKVSQNLTGLYGTISEATFYARRNETLGICCPVVNTGKVHSQNVAIENPTFTTSMEPWQELLWKSGTIAWTYNAGAGTMDVTLTLGQFSRMIENASVKLKAGNKYKLSFVYTMSINAGLTLEVYYRNNGSWVSWHDRIETTLGTKNYSVTLDIFQDSDSIAFVMNRHATAGTMAVTVSEFNVEWVTPQNEINVLQGDVRFFRPAYAWQNLLEQALFNSGAKHGVTEFYFTGQQQAFLDTLVLYSSRGENKYSDEWLEARRVETEGSGSQVVNMTHPTVSTSLTINSNVIKADSVGGTIGSSSYTFPNLSFGFYADVILEVVINVTAISGGASGALQVVHNGVVMETPSVDRFATTGRKQLVLNTFGFDATKTKGCLFDNTTTTFAIVNKTAAGNITGTLEKVIVRIVPVTHFQDEVADIENLYTPDVTIFELLKDFLVRTCSLVRVRESDNVLEIRSLQYILNNRAKILAVARNAVQVDAVEYDWTDKRIFDEDDSEAYQITNFAQVNYFQDQNYLRNAESRMTLNVVNRNILEEQIYFTSLMNTEKNKVVATMRLLDLDIMTDETEADAGVVWNSWTSAKREFNMKFNEKLVLAKTRANLSTDPTIKFGTTTAADFRVAEYCEPKDFKEAFYSGLEEALKEGKVVSRKYRINKEDENYLDTWCPIHDNGETFILLTYKKTEATADCLMLRVF